MAFDWSWSGMLQKAAQQGMEGYNPAGSIAAAQMQGYAPTPVVNAGSQGGAIDRGNAMQVSQEQAMQQQQQEQAAMNRQKRIADIQSEIAMLEKRIADNTAKLHNFTGNAGQIAAIEARKINAQDPTSIWRWKQGQDQTMAIRKQDLERIEQEKEKTKEEQKQFIRNKLASTLPTMTIGWGTSPEQIQQYKNTLAGLKTEVMNNKLTDQYNNILELEAQLNGQLPKQKAQMAMDAMTNATNLFDVTKDEGGFGKDPKAYHDYLLQQYTAITKEFPEAKYDPEFNKAFMEADKLHRKKVKNPTVRPGGRH